MADTRPTSDLRTRRRVEIRQQVGTVALRLFEEKGVSGTTVDDIAAEAGISPRTFFRHFETKEDAVLTGYMDVEDAAAELNLGGTDSAAALMLIQEMYASMLDDLADDESEYLAVQKLIAREPGLQQAAERRLRTSTERLRSRLEENFGQQHALIARLLVHVTSATLHAALEEWTYRSGDQPPTNVADLYRRACQELRQLISQP
ncbi:TetR/AcrR family transcriptional regulator [Brevibacterium zhoupengii]|uniref:TetR/AcrR family transcriptional regulator n=1 Tax=Brevibacterium zhoupengii TaxID=2898795 RepID=UPI001E39245C|nr:TetR/AcrR family transcriptional regulator [Brevibacterium zhoupengii]